MASLNSFKLVAFVGTDNMKSAKDFYAGQLGLQLVTDDGFALVFDVHGTMLRVTQVGKVTPAVYTVLGWEVPEIAEAASQLKAAGVALERFPGLAQDELGIWTAPGEGARVAWFKDPSGNILSISEHS